MNQRFEESAGGIVFKEESDVKGNKKTLWLITQHSQYKGWSFPKGIIADNHSSETMEDAALREVKEEGGIEAQIVKPNSVQTSYNYRDKEVLVKKTVNYFLMEYLSGDPKDHDWEVSEAKFVTEDEVRSTLSYTGDKEAFEKILLLYKGE